MISASSIAQKGARGKVYSVVVNVSEDHPLLMLKGELDWNAIRTVIVDNLRRAGRNVDGTRRGRKLDVDLYVPLLVLMMVMKHDSRQMESYLSENAVARLFVGVQGLGDVQIRDHSNIARIHASLDAQAQEELTALIIRLAIARGFADASVQSADTTAQELPIGYPHEAGILKGFAERVIRGCKKLRSLGKRLLSPSVDAAVDIVRKAKEYHLFAKTKERKDAIIKNMVGKAQSILTELEALSARHRHAGEQAARSVSRTFDELLTVTRKLLPQVTYWLETGKVASGKILHVGFPQARAIVRNKLGKKVEFGLQYLISTIGGGYLFVRSIDVPTGEVHMPQLALADYRKVLGDDKTPELFVFDRGGWSQQNVVTLKEEGVVKVGIQPKGKARWRVHGTDREQVMSERGKIEGKIGTLKSSYGFNKPRQRRHDTLMAAGRRSATSFNLRKFMQDTVSKAKKQAALA